MSAMSSAAEKSPNMQALQQRCKWDAAWRVAQGGIAV